MTNNPAIPSTGAGASFSPQPVSNSYSSGTPPEGPRSALVFLTLPTGQPAGQINVNLSQFQMSMVQSILIDNEGNNVGISVSAGNPQQAITFGIPPGGTQIIPVFQSGVNLTINVTALNGATDINGNPTPIALAFQVFNSYVPPASWVADLTVNGSVDINQVSGGVNVLVNNSASIGVGILSEPTGGAGSKLLTGLSTTVTQIKPAAGTVTFKGFAGQSAAAGWLQLFDAATPGAVALGTTPPAYSFPFLAATPFSAIVPPEGLACANGLQAAWTTTINGSVAPASAWQGNIFYA